MIEKIMQQMEFILEVDKVKEIFRQNYLADGSRRENDAEHSWHLALMVCLLKEYANEDINVEHTIYMVLIHDLVEIDAGDTYAYDEKENQTKRERELMAAERIFGLLPKEQAEFVRALWDEFEEAKTPEAKFANTLDKLQPLLLNAASEGKSWKEHEVKLSQIMKRNEHTAEGSEKLWNYAYQIICENIKNGRLIDDTQTDAK